MSLSPGRLGIISRLARAAPDHEPKQRAHECRPASECAASIPRPSGSTVCRLQLAVRAFPNRYLRNRSRRRAASTSPSSLCEPEPPEWHQSLWALLRSSGCVPVRTSEQSDGLIDHPRLAGSSTARQHRTAKDFITCASRKCRPVASEVSTHVIEVIVKDRGEQHHRILRA